MLAAIAAELRATEKADQAEHEQAWTQFLGESDAVFKLAVEAVRPAYLQKLADLRISELFRRGFTELREGVGYVPDPYVEQYLDEFRTKVETAFEARPVLARLAAPMMLQVSVFGALLVVAAVRNTCVRGRRGPHPVHEVTRG